MVLLFSMFRGGAVSEAMALDTRDTPHELDPVAAVELLDVTMYTG